MRPMGASVSCRSDSVLKLPAGPLALRLKPSFKARRRDRLAEEAMSEANAGGREVPGSGPAGLGTHVQPELFVVTRLSAIC
jgi:hypothetical protein